MLLASGPQPGALHFVLASRGAYQESITKWLFDDPRYPANVLGCIQEQHQIHARLVLLVVLCQIPFYTCQQPGLIHYWLILLVVPSLQTQQVRSV